MNQFDPVSNPYTTLPLLYTASPVQDINTGWLGQYSRRFHYPTVIEFFKYLGLSGLPSLKEAGRLLYFGDDHFNGTWTIALEEKHAYGTVPTLRFEIGGRSRVFDSTVNTTGANNIIPHTLAWLNEAWSWFLSQVPGSSLAFPSWEAFVGVPATAVGSPPGDVGENEYDSYSSSSSLSSANSSSSSSSSSESSGSSSSSSINSSSSSSRSSRSSGSSSSSSANSSSSSSKSSSSSRSSSSSSSSSSS